ncbi:MAG: hypothetical protein NZM25_06505 [Leptospiraceae bacterium]|nr:hypothetical protein [Leptospiraceae bacterium]MDW8306573.1 hypothetical protein [Leptospiraceae bacterium]
MHLLGTSKKLLAFLVVAALFVALALDPRLRSQVGANFSYASALVVSVLIPAFLSYLWNFFSQGRPFYFFLLYFSALTGFLLLAQELDFLSVVISLFEGKKSLFMQNKTLFALVAIAGILLFFHYTANVIFYRDFSLGRFLLLTFLYLSYSSLVLNSLKRLFLRL